MEELLKKLKNFSKGKYKQTIFLLLGIFGIIFIGLSSCNEGKDKEPVPQISQSQSDEEYCTLLEEKISQIVTAITGDEKCLVAVTLENGSEYVYADQSKTNTDQTEDKAADGVTTKESVKSENEYIIVENEDGSQTALMVTEKKPSVRGVAVVSGGINGKSKEQILTSVMAMLGIPSRKVSITSKAITD